MLTTLSDHVKDSAAYISKIIGSVSEYKVAIVLGTGLSELIKDIDINISINYSDIPHFPTSTVQSHQGKLIFGKMLGKAIVIMSGRFHYYEGYDMDQVTFGVRVLSDLGIKTLLLTNVSGGLNESYDAGDIAIVKDHINLHPVNPLRGPNDEKLGLRFPDMSATYDKELRNIAIQILRENNITHHESVYIGLQGPNLETPAETKYLRIIGGDIVGMSTVPEVIVARYLGIKCFCSSVISNKCIPEGSTVETTIESIIEIANQAEPKLSLLLKEMLKRID